MVNASAQRTMAGQGYISADCLYDFENFGAKAEYGQYTLGGFWSVGTICMAAVGCLWVQKCSIR